jgi:hypothetical protein
MKKIYLLTLIIFMFSINLVSASQYEMVTIINSTPTSGDYTSNFTIGSNVWTSASYTENVATYINVDGSWFQACGNQATWSGNKSFFCQINLSLLGVSFEPSLFYTVRTSTNYDGCGSYTPTPDTINCGHFNDTTIFVGSYDSIAPRINITYPNNQTYITNIVALNYSVSDNVGLNSCGYSLNNGITNTTITCGINITGLNSTQGSNTWTVYTNDTNGNRNFSQVTFFVDSIAPKIGYISPTETNGSIITRNNLLVNVDVNDTNFANLTVRLFNSTGLINITTRNFNNGFFNYTGLTNGTYYFNATAYDFFGNTNSTQTRTVIINVTNQTDNSILKVYLTTPENNVNNPAGFYIHLRANFTSTFGLKNATLYVWYTNSTLKEVISGNLTGTSNNTGFIPTSIFLSPGTSYLWNYLAYDVAGNSAWNNTNWTINIV